MHDTSHPILPNLFPPADLTSSSESKSQARMCSERLQVALEAALKTSLHGRGSTIYRIGWKPHVTPSGRAISRLRASARRTSGNAPSSEPSLYGWTTPQAHDTSPRGKGQKAKHGTKHGCADLNADAMLSGWATPTAEDGRRGVKDPRPTDTGIPLSQYAALSGWPTPMSADNRDRGFWDDPAIQRRKRLGKSIELSMLVGVAGWPTPNASNGSGGGQAKRGDEPGAVERAERLRDAVELDDGGRPRPSDDPWRDADWLFCRDGKWRPVEPGTFPLAHGISGRVVRLRAYGNAIVPQAAAAFIRSFMTAVATTRI
jgi:hypothetical protein